MLCDHEAYAWGAFGGCVCAAESQCPSGRAWYILLPPFLKSGHNILHLATHKWGSKMGKASSSALRNSCEAYMYKIKKPKWLIWHILWWYVVLNTKLSTSWVGSNKIKLGNRKNNWIAIPPPSLCYAVLPVGVVNVPLVNFWIKNRVCLRLTTLQKKKKCRDYSQRCGLEGEIVKWNILNKNLKTYNTTHKHAMTKPDN